MSVHIILRKLLKYRFVLAIYKFFSMEKDQQLTPNEVFTPRGEFNPKMYTSREILEKDLRKNLRGSGHLILYGESGCGKSWLYKSFFSSNSVYFKIVNLADANRNGNISSEILRVVKGAGVPTQTSFTQKKNASVGIPHVVSGGIAQDNKFEFSPTDPLRDSIEKFRTDAGSKIAFLVLDNLERIFDKPTLMEELADIVTLADDEEFIKHKVRFLLVGVPSGVKEYFNRTPSRRTIANRLTELKEVSRLSSEECRDLVIKGFLEELGYQFETNAQTEIIDHVEHVTDRIPQAVQEYCLELALLAEQGRVLERSMLLVADKQWLTSSLNAAYTVIENQLNVRETTLQRRNQVIFAVGQLEEQEFRDLQVEHQVRKIFYKGDTGASVGGVPNALNELADPTRNDGAGALLRKTPRGDAFMFLDPQYRMCIRAMLKVGVGNSVEKVSLEGVQQ